MGLLASVPINNLLGTRTSSGVAVPQGATRAIVDFDESTMTDANTRIAATIDFAPDGATWRQICKNDIVVQPGVLDRHGNPITYQVNCDIPQEGATPQLRGSITVTGARLTTTLRVSTEP
jgi:hypothetical protein